MSNLETMQARIAQEVRRADLLEQIVPSILSAITHYQRSPFYFLEGEATASTVADQANYAAPTDHLETDSLTLTSDGSRRLLEPIAWSRYRTLSESTTLTARPEKWAFYANEHWLYPTPDDVYTLTQSYIQELTAVSAGTDTNAWFVEGEELIRARAKWSLFTDGQDFAAADRMEAMWQRAESELLSKSARRNRISKLRVDDAFLAGGGGGYNINLG